MNKKDIEELLNDLSDSIKEKWNSLSPTRKKIIAGLLALGVASTAIESIIKLVVNDDKLDDKLSAKKGVLYLVDVKDELKGINIKDKDNKDINYKFDQDTLAIVGEKDGKTKNGKMHEVVLVSEDGEVTYGYMDGKYLSNVSLDDIEVVSKDFNIFMVSAPDVINLETSVSEQDTLTTLLLAPKSTVLGATTATSSEESTKLLREVILVNNNKFVTGFVNNNALFNQDFEKNVDVDYKVSAEELNLREEHSTDSNTLGSLYYGDAIKLISDVESYNDGEYEWVYIASYDKVNNKIKFGWVAKTDYTTVEPTQYIKEVKKYESSNESSNSKVIQLSINAKDGLNLRDDSSINSYIIANLISSTTLFTTQADYNNSISNDGYEWVHVSLVDGTEGWVCKDYVDILDERNIEVKKGSLNTLDFYSFGMQEGYFGIDINLGTPAEEVDKILKNGIKFNSSPYVSSDETFKPSYVILKCGATGFGNDGPMKFATVFNSEGSNYNELINVFQKNNVPFGIYYYSQATTEREAREEINLIKQAHEEASKYSLYSKNIFLDFECYGYDCGVSYDARIKTNADIYGKDTQTEVVNKMFKIAQDKISDAKIRIYTDANTLTTTINYDLLSSSIKNDFGWYVNTSYEHHTNLLNNNVVSNNIGMFQIQIDTPVYNTCVDLDYMYKDMYNDFVSNMRINNVIDSTSDSSYYESSEPNLYSESCCVIDASTGEVLYGINEDELKSPASITKILSCYIALKYGNLDDKVTYTRRATTLSMPGTEYTASDYNSARTDIVYDGNTITLRDALHLSLFLSDNCTTVAIEEYVKDKLNCDFYELMNQEAKNMGCTNPRFTNSFGYEDPNHLVSAHDMAKILAYIINNPTGNDVEIIDIMRKEQYTFSDGITTLYSQNNPYYSDDVLGIKTGGHDLAGGTIVEAFKRGDRTLVVVDMGVDMSSWSLIYTDARNLANYCFNKKNDLVQTCYTNQEQIKVKVLNNNRVG